MEFDHVITSEIHDESIKPKDGRNPRKLETKNLALLRMNRKERNIIIIDSKVQGFSYYITNGIFVPPFPGPPNHLNPISDSFFIYLFEYLKGFETVDDVKPKIERDFDLKNRFSKSFKNPAMDKLRSLQKQEEEHSGKSRVVNKCSTPKIETSFRRNSRLLISNNDLMSIRKIANHK